MAGHGSVVARSETAKQSLLRKICPANMHVTTQPLGLSQTSQGFSTKGAIQNLPQNPRIRSRRLYRQASSCPGMGAGKGCPYARNSTARPFRFMLKMARRIPFWQSVYSLGPQTARGICFLYAENYTALTRVISPTMPVNVVAKKRP